MTDTTTTATSPTATTTTNGRAWSNIHASRSSLRTSNPIRLIVDQLNPSQANKDKALIPLSIGDPTVFGNLETDDHVNRAVISAIQSHKFNGYAHACGYAEARVAIAQKYAEKFATNSNHFTPDDVTLASGCSGAIQMCIDALANEGDNILIPTPGFSLYKTLCDHKGIECHFYPLIAERNWEVDLSAMRELINDRTRAILINNPSNPCGSVYSKQHILDILKLAQEYCLPIIADEIYADMTFERNAFVPMYTCTDQVPILTVGGIAKQYLVPGWRVGWIVVHDPQGYLGEVRQGLARLATLILGPNTLVQGALPTILKETPQSFYDDLNGKLKENADYTYERISKIKGLRVIRPGGAMYCMVGIDVDRFGADITDDVSFSRILLQEESVFVLPGQCFRMPNFFRIVICPPKDKLQEAYDRLEQFCQRRYQE